MEFVQENEEDQGRSAYNGVLQSGNSHLLSFAKQELCVT